MCVCVCGGGGGGVGNHMDESAIWEKIVQQNRTRQTKPKWLQSYNLKVDPVQFQVNPVQFQVNPV